MSQGFGRQWNDRAHPTESAEKKVKQQTRMIIPSKSPLSRWYVRQLRYNPRMMIPWDSYQEL